MKIEKTTLIEFDVVAERERIDSVFKGAERVALRTVVDRFELGEFEDLAREGVTWTREFAEFVHPVILGVLRDVTLRQHQVLLASQGNFPEKHERSEREQMLLRLAGTPVGSDALSYPRFKRKYDPSEKFENPNDVEVQHSYCLHILASMTHGLVGAFNAMEDAQADPTAVKNFLAKKHGLRESARQFYAQLLGEPVPASKAPVLPESASANEAAPPVANPATTPKFTRCVSVTGQYNASFVFEGDEQVTAWLRDELPSLEHKYGSLYHSTSELPGLQPGDTCFVYGEGSDTFVITKLIQHSPHRFGFVLDSGCSEEVAKCYLPTDN